jgi:hypothetical protein
MSFEFTCWLHGTFETVHTFTYLLEQIYTKSGRQLWFLSSTVWLPDFNMRIKCVLLYVDVIRKLLQMWRHISVFLWSWIFIYHSSKHRFLCHVFNFLSVSTICTIVSPHTTIFVNSSYVISSKVHPLTRKQIPVKSLIRKNRAGVTKNYLCENYCKKLYDLMHIVYYLKILYFPADDFAWRHISGITEENNQKKKKSDWLPVVRNVLTEICFLPQRNAPCCHQKSLSK